MHTASCTRTWASWILGSERDWAKFNTRRHGKNDTRWDKMRQGNNKHSDGTSGSAFRCNSPFSKQFRPDQHGYQHTSAYISNERMFTLFPLQLLIGIDTGETWSWCLQQLWAGLQSSHQLRRHPRLAKLPRCVQHISIRSANMGQNRTARTTARAKICDAMSKTVSKGPNATPQDSLHSWIFMAPALCFLVRDGEELAISEQNCKCWTSTAWQNAINRARQSISKDWKQWEKRNARILWRISRKKQTWTSCDCCTMCLILLQLLHSLHSLLNLPQNATDLNRFATRSGSGWFWIPVLQCTAVQAASGICRLIRLASFLGTHIDIKSGHRKMQIIYI